MTAIVKIICNATMSAIGVKENSGYAYKVLFEHFRQVLAKTMKTSSYATIQLVFEMGQHKELYSQIKVESWARNQTLQKSQKT